MGSEHYAPNGASSTYQSSQQPEQAPSQQQADAPAQPNHDTYASQTQSEQGFGTSSAPTYGQPYYGYAQSQQYTYEPHQGQGNVYNQTYGANTQQQTYTYYSQPQSYQYAEPAPVRADSKYFALSVAGIVFTRLAMCIPGLICSIVAIAKWNREKQVNSGIPLDTKTRTLSIIGIVLGAVGIVMQAIVVVSFAAILTFSNGVFDDAFFNDIQSGTLNANNAQSQSETTGQDLSDMFVDTENDSRLNGIGVTSPLDTSDSMTVSYGNVFYLEIPSTWVSYDTLDGNEELPSTAYAYADPNATYYSETYGAEEYSCIVVLDAYNANYKTVLESCCDYLSGQDDYTNIKARDITVDGRNAVVIASDFSADNKVTYDFFIELGSDTCAYVYFEAPADQAAYIASCIKSFSTEPSYAV